MTAVAGRYELITRVAVTGSGALWHGRDGELARDVALKQASLSAGTIVQRLRAEARTLAGLQHPNVVAVFGLVEDEGSAWLVEEWVPGVALPAILEQTDRLRPQQALGVVRGALTGLAYTHQRHIVHGDVSAGNILLDVAGVSKLVDFGLASPADGVDASPRVDVHGAGTVLAALLTGRANADDLAGVSGSVRPVLARALAADPQQRYPDAAEFLTALEDAAQRDHGAGWLSEASVAGLVAAAGTAAAARVSGGESTIAGTATAAARLSGGASTIAGTATAAATAAGSTSGVRRALRPRYVAAGAVAAAVVAGVVIFAVTNSSGSPKPQAGARTSSSTTSTPITARTTPGATTLAATAPNGRYQITGVVTSSDNNSVASNKVGYRASSVWTITLACGGQRCTGQAISSSGKVFSLTFDGTTLRATRRASSKLRCFYSSGPNTGKPVPNSYVNFVDNAMFMFTVPPNSAGGPPRELRGTEHAIGTDSKGPGICPVDPTVHIAFTVLLTRKG